jgi:hypothetical protein
VVEYEVGGFVAAFITCVILRATAKIKIMCVM